MKSLNIAKIKAFIRDNKQAELKALALTLPLHSTPESAAFQQKNETKPMVGTLQNLIANGLISVESAQDFIDTL